MSTPVEHWHADHVRFSRLLDFLQREITKFHYDEHPDYELMRDIVYYLRRFADQVHHPREDVAFARMIERDTGLRLPIARLQQEHRIIANAGQALLLRLDDVAAEAVVERSALEAAAATYLLYYRHHIALEEEEVLPRAGDLLDASDWGAVAAAVPDHPDPLFQDNAREFYRELRFRLSV